MRASAPLSSVPWRRSLAQRTTPVSNCFLPGHLSTSLRSVFVRFQPTPNDACYKFYVDDVQFLPPNSHTMMFDGTNSYLSPLAHVLLEALPMVEEVTVSTSFVTVKRVEEEDTASAARYFAMKLHGTQQSAPVEEAAAAARSEALQKCVDEVLREEKPTNASGSTSPEDCVASVSASSTVAPMLPEEATDASVDVSGFTMSPSAQDEVVDEAALQALIASTDWSELKYHVSALLTDHLSSGHPHVDPNAPHPHADTLPEKDDSDVVLMIKELIANTIRPLLQDDGGDIRMIRFDPDNGDLFVELLGACRTCRSSKTTLVDLIERTTRHWIPEVTAVREASRIATAFEEFVASRRLGGQKGTTEDGSKEDAREKQPQQSDNPESSTEETVKFGASRPPEPSDASPGYRIVRKVGPSSKDAGMASRTAAAGAKL